MNNTELIERYIYAVTKHLPKKSRREVAQELEFVISDLLEGRCGEAEPSSEDVRTVLTELGAPGALAEQYDPERQNCLIGGAYYSQYRLVLKIVLLCVALGLAVAGGVSAVFDTSPWAESFASWLATLIQTLVSAFAWVTLIFAFLYHKGVKMEEKSEGLEDLPPVPSEKLRISRGESAFDIVATMIFTLVFLLTPQMIFVYLAEGGLYPGF